jgi:hypothetical protein
VAGFQVMEPFTKKVKNQKKISDHENGINDELNQERA